MEALSWWRPTAALPYDPTFPSIQNDFLQIHALLRNRIITMCEQCLCKKNVLIERSLTSLDPKYFHRPWHWSNLVCLWTKWEGVASSRLILFLRYSLYALSPTWSPPPHYSCLLIIGETITAAREYLCCSTSLLLYVAVSASVIIWVPKSGESKSGQMVPEKVIWS